MRAFVEDRQMRSFEPRRSRKTAIALLLCAGVVAAGATAAPQAAPPKDTPKQTLFSTPDDAMRALAAATRAKDQAALTAIFGPDRERLLSGDPVEDNRALEHFAADLDKSARLVKADDAKFTVVIGETNWPFPIPIVRAGSQWRFDTAAGLEEILNRRIGDNELSAIMTCRAYVIAQWEYFTQPLDTSQDGMAVYAQRFISSPGTRDGLYWETAPGEKPSPLGALVADARAEGYNAGRPRNDAGQAGAPARKRSPYHGYHFRILTSQGSHAPGGSFSYIINGNMIAGYAEIAYPDKWGSSGIMTFIVNQQGRIYQKNLGQDTESIAAGIMEYDPDPTWTLVKEP
jgi:hypothetical protein